MFYSELAYNGMRKKSLLLSSLKKLYGHAESRRKK